MSSISLIGLPNSGKSSLFNWLTKTKQRVANFPGITVEKKVGTLTLDGKTLEVVDLPGIYTLDVSTLDEKVTRDYIFQKQVDKLDSTIVFVVDATNLKRSLYLAKQLQEIGRDFIVALNMYDISNKRGQKLDIKNLSDHLGGAPVLPIVATSGEGVDDLLKTLKVYKDKTKEVHYTSDYQKKIKQPNYIKEKLKEVEVILKDVVKKEISDDTLTEKLDSLLLHPVWGVFILFIVLIGIFQLLFSWSDPFMDGIESLFTLLSKLVTEVVPPGYIQSLLVDGIITGVGGVLVFLPHIVFLFLIIYFLEDFGYLGRVAFLLDYLMRRFGLPGKAVVPLLSSHACAIPGIMSARIIDNPFQRMVTMMISPLMTCSARLPVYTLLIGVIVPNTNVFGFLGLPGLVLFGLYMFGIVSGFGISFIAKKAIVSTSPSYLLMELPPYRLPKLGAIVKRSLNKGWLFIKKAGTVILVLSMLIWTLVTFPAPPEGSQTNDIEYSYAGRIGKTVEPVFKPLGFDWKITTALIPSFGARELLVSSLGTVYAVGGEDVESEGFISDLSSILNARYSLATLMSLLIWFVFAPQCIATFGVLKKETNGYKMPLLFGAYTLALAYGFSFLTYQILS